MDPVTLVVAALAGGAVRGVGETAAAAVRDAYDGLRRMVAEHFNGDPLRTRVLSEHEQDPASWHEPMIKILTDSGVSTDVPLIQAAQGLLTLLAGPASQAVIVRDSQGVQVGHNNQQHNTFNASASGEQ